MLAISLAVSSTPGAASEAVMGWVYLLDLTPKGGKELQFWNTYGRGQSNGKYNLNEPRVEFEYGVTDDFQVGLYYNWGRMVSANGNGVDGTTYGKAIPENHNPSQPYSGQDRDGVSVEFIYRILSPYKDPIGFGVYLEPRWGRDGFRELEGKLLFQKNFLDDRLIWGANITLSPEWEPKTGNPSCTAGDEDCLPRKEKSMELEFTTGLMYRFRPGWFAGAEYRNHREYSAHSLAPQYREHSAHFFGPTIHYAAKSWWASLNWMHQLPVASCYSADNCENMVGNRIYGDEHERNIFRLRMGYVF
jgi:hypothetical protein